MTEIARILALPRRQPSDLAALAQELTALLRTPTGNMSLRQIQALALHDIGTCNGGFLPIGVGLGKTIISLLAAFVLNARKSLLLLPASLIEKTQREREKLARHWLIPNTVRLFSYDKLGKEQYANELETYKPDLIICDEVHRLKNDRAAVTKRVARYMRLYPATMFVGMSGTIMRKSLHDFAHILKWALKGNAPIPLTESELELWARILDEPADIAAELERPDPKPVLALCVPGELGKYNEITAVRRGFRARLVETPGVVANAGEDERVDCSIYLQAHITKVEPITEQHFRRLRSLSERPDGKPFERGADIWACARQLALGFHYEWDPGPPQDWLNARREWSAFVREVLSRSRTLDSPLQVVNAIDAGSLREGSQSRGVQLLAAWRVVRDTFRPNTVAVWHDTTVLKQCAQWAQRPGIVWVEHRLFGDRLARETRLPYFGESGFSSDGVYIEDAPPGSIIASLRANKDGKNLQSKWSRNLVVSPPDGWDVWQQMIGRTHRPGQLADAVEIDVLWGCREHVNAWTNALAGTYAARDTTGSDDPTAYKLLLADVVVPGVDDIARLGGARWAST